MNLLAKHHALANPQAQPEAEAGEQGGRRNRGTAPLAVAEQLTIGGSETAAPTNGPRPLTARQQHALDTIRQAGPGGIDSTSLGQTIHAIRGSHNSDHECKWCHATGAELGRALRVRKLAWKRNRTHWTLVEHRGVTPKPQVDGYDPRSSDWPEGF